jgi:transposase
MQVVYERCAGLDVHKKTVVACVLISSAKGTATQEVQTFGTMTRDLGELSAWLRELQVEQVCLESTGVYWVPVFNLLEEAGLPVTLVNAGHVKQVPGHKTDVGDAVWLADLLRHGLLRASFIPPAEIRALRELTRYRANLVRARATEANHALKTLEVANLKLGSVATDALGASGWAMLTAIAAGEDDPAVLAQMAKAGLRKKLDELEQALTGRIKPHHRVLIRASLDHLRCLESMIEQLDLEVKRAMTPFAAQQATLDAVPGIDAVAAAAVLAEIGVQMDQFPTAAHLASWAGVCPGNKQSGGRRLSSATTKGNVWLRRILGEVAWAAIRTRDSIFRARYYRLKPRLGAQQALVAIMHQLLKLIYHILKTGELYRELGADYYQKADPQRTAQHLAKRIERLGFTVTLAPVPTAKAS